MRIELIYDDDCPNAPAAREALAVAISQAGLTPGWQEWERSDPAAPAYVRDWGSPTILVEGRDVGGAEGSQGKACRVYVDENGKMRGTPTIRMVLAAIQTGAATSRRTGKEGTLWAALPAASLAFVPGITCAGCWPAYAALAGSLGIGFFNYTPLLLPAMVLLLAVAAGSMAFGARAKQTYGPLLLGILAAAGILLFKFVFPHDSALYGSTAILIGASVWNLRARKTAATPDCPACTESTNG